MTIFAFSFGITTLLMFLSTTYMFLTNTTTIENAALSRYNPFNKGFRNNWRQVFRDQSWYMWFLPVRVKYSNYEYV
jgi:hypothetical protein